MNKTAVLALDLSPAAEPLLQCAAELRRWGVGTLIVTHVVRMGYGQAPGDRALQEITEWLEGRAARMRSAPLRVDAAGGHGEALLREGDPHEVCRCPEGPENAWHRTPPHQRPPARLSTP